MRRVSRFSFAFGVEEEVRISGTVEVVYRSAEQRRTQRKVQKKVPYVQYLRFEQVVIPNPYDQRHEHLH